VFTKRAYTTHPLPPRLNVQVTGSRRTRPAQNGAAVGLQHEYRNRHPVNAGSLVEEHVPRADQRRPPARPAVGYKPPPPTIVASRIRQRAAQASMQGKRVVEVCSVARFTAAPAPSAACHVATPPLLVPHPGVSQRSTALERGGEAAWVLEKGGV